jgi:hypothetical protein
MGSGLKRLGWRRVSASPWFWTLWVLEGEAGSQADGAAAVDALLRVAAVGATEVGVVVDKVGCDGQQFGLLARSWR